jgi:hypothetical protein
MTHIINAVSRVTGVSEGQMLGIEPSKLPKFTFEARIIAQFIAYVHEEVDGKEVAKAFGMDYGWLVKNIRKAGKRMDNEMFYYRYGRVMDILYPQRMAA